MGKIYFELFYESNLVKYMSFALEIDNLEALFTVAPFQANCSNWFFHLSEDRH